ncbi:flagellar biosynthesis protein FlgF, partial [bacterium]
MNRGVYSAAMGMSAAQRWMEVASNNLANVSTDGYKADGIAFGDALVREMHT